MQLLVLSDERGNLREHTRYGALGRTGADRFVCLSDKDVAPLPDGSALHFLPGRLPRGVNLKKGRFSSADEIPGLAVAAVLPPGWVRTRVPAWHRVKGAPPLPFFSYTAVSFQGDGFHVPAIFLEDDFRWSPSQYDGRELKGNVERMLKTHPSNRLMRHLSRCALDYHCYTAQNIFYNRWEGGIPTSSACNASCYGCLSCQESDELTSPQERIGFTPTVDEILEIAVPHLESESAIVSFGQGCEGEPSLLGDLLEEAIRAIRARTAGGTLHLNSNGSRPEILARLFDAGLDSIRVSINSALADDYERYFRPRGYGFDDVLKTLSYAKERGRHISLNLLTLPGFTDREDQIEAVVSLIRTYGIHKVQLRDLNGDPDILYSVLAAKGPERRKVVGIAEMIDRLRREIPRLAVGCFNPSHLPAAACASQRSDLQTGGGPTSR